MDVCKTILIVDDSHADRLALERYIRESLDDVAVHHADCAEDALEVCQSSQPDCILLDYNLPGLNGIEFLNSFYESSADYVPTIMLTGQGNESVAVESLQQGACDYLKKSHLDKNVLSSAIVRVINRANQQKIVNKIQDKLIQFSTTLAAGLVMPLKNITFLANDIKHHIDAKVDETVIDSVNHIVASSNRTLAFIDTVLLYKDFETNTTVTNIDLNELFNLTIKQSEFNLRKKNIVVTVEPLPKIIASQTLISKAITCLLSALAHQPTEAAQTSIQIMANQHDKHLVITLHDSRVLTIDDISVDSERTENNLSYELATCQQILSFYEGQVLHNTSQQGTTFYILLPNDLLCL